MSSTQQKTPPGPENKAWFGSLGEMRKNPMQFFTSVAINYGGIARIRFGRNQYSYLVSEPALIRELLITNRTKYIKNNRYQLLAGVLGDGLLLSEGDSWRRQRQIIQPAFRQEALLLQVEKSSKTVATFLDRFDELVKDGAAFDIHTQFARLTQLLAGQWIMGQPFEKRSNDIADLFELAVKAWPHAPKSVLAAYRIPPLRKIITLKRAIKALDHCLFEIINDYRSSPEGNNGLIPMLVNGHREMTGGELTDKELRDQLVTLFIAAHETSSSSLCWVHYFLSLYPEVRERVQREVKAQLAERLVAAEDLPKLSYLEQVIQESLRIYSPIHSLSRVAIEDNTVGGYLIPKGSTVIVSLYATHRLPKYWDNPEAFDPERFSKENCSKRPSSAFIPFAIGHRNCIGGMQAMIQSKIIISQIAQRFTIDLLPGHPVVPSPGTTMYPRYGMQVTIRHK